MRASVSRVFDHDRPDPCWHFGLVYDRLLMFTGDDLENTDAKNDWLNLLESTQIGPDYGDFYQRWLASLEEPGTCIKTCQAASRLFVGQGNPSGSEVGLTVHHTWGVPLIPGSALKGMLAHYVATVYGARAGDNDPERERWRGVTWEKNRIIRGPGELYRALFGAPDVDGEKDEASGACAGAVIFHDALYVPRPGGQDRPFARDVLTVHQKSYYDSRGGTAPNDYDDPNPVGFLNVKPKSQFLLALSGPADWTSLAMQILLEALDDWGVGGKTSLGYGRLVAVDNDPKPADSAIQAGREEERVPSQAGPSGLLVEFEVALKGKDGALVRDTLAHLLDQWPDRVLALDTQERRLVASSLDKKRKKLKKGRDDDLAIQLGTWIAQLRGEPPS